MKKASFSVASVCLYGLLAILLAACGSLNPYVSASGPVTSEGLTMSWSPDGQWLVFPSSIAAVAPELYALNVAQALDGAGRDKWIHLSQGFSDVIGRGNLDAASYMHLAWSPDGERIAFTAGDKVYTFDAACLEAPATCAEGLTVMMGGASGWLTMEWSPDSSLLLLESTLAGPLVKTDKGVMADNFVIVMSVVVADGSQEVVLTRETPPRQAPGWQEYSPFSPAWSPDGEKILYASGKAGQSDLYTLTLDGEQVAQLTDTPDVPESSPSWSPDGGQIIYVVTLKGQYNLYSQRLDGGALTCVTCQVRPSWEHFLLWPKWSPDGTQIAYGISGKPPLFGQGNPIYIYMIAPDGGDQVPVVEKGFPGPPFWSPDGTRLAFAFRARSPLKSMESDIYLINADGSGFTDLTP